MIEFPENLYIGAFLAAFVATRCGAAAWIRLSERVGLVDHPGLRKIHQQTTPLAGGLMVMTGLLMPALVGGLIVAFFPEWLPDSSRASLSHGMASQWLPFGGIMLGAIGMFLVGLWDDRSALSPGRKFLGQFLVSLLVASAGVRITLFIDNLWIAYAITILWMLTLVNTFNFMDNMNGLSAGLGAIACLSFGLSAWVSGHYLVASFAFCVTGALVGFLPCNFPRAKTFLGDSGSHLTGYLVAVLGILPHFYTGNAEEVRWAVLKPVIIVSIPLIDLCSVVWIRRRLGKPFYQGDTNHLSHRLHRQGLSETRVVLILWALGAVAGAVTFLF